MQALVCLAELEGLHIQQSASTFDKCNKEGLVRGLWRNHKHERKVGDSSYKRGNVRSYSETRAIAYLRVA